LTRARRATPCKEEALKIMSFLERKYFYTKVGSKIQSQKILFYYLHIYTKLRHIFSSIFSKVNHLLLAKKDGGFCKDGPP